MRLLRIRDAITKRTLQVLIPPSFRSSHEEHRVK